MTQVIKQEAKNTVVNIEHTLRPYYASVSQVCSADGYLQFGINPDRVDLCVAKVLSALDDFKADEVVTAIGIAFILIMKRFEFHLPSYINFIENYLYRGGDLKMACHAMERMFGCLFDNHLTRFEKINFNNTRTVDFRK